MVHFVILVLENDIVRIFGHVCIGKYFLYSICLLEMLWEARHRYFLDFCEYFSLVPNEELDFPDWIQNFPQMTI